MQDVITQFQIGNYRGVISAASSLEPEDEGLKVERDVYLFRSYLALGQGQLVLDELKNSENSALRGVRALAAHSVDQVDEMRADAVASQNPTFQVLGSLVLEKEGRLEDALVLLHPCKVLEARALKVKLYLAMDRVSHAEKEYALMQQYDDDAVLTQLAASWLCLYSGAPIKVKEALAIYEELVEKYQGTPLLLNGVAVCNMHLGNWDEAETSLKEAFEQDASNADVLVNMSLVASHTGKSTLSNRYLAQVKTSTRGPNAWIQRREAAEAEFDSEAQAFST